MCKYKLKLSFTWSPTPVPCNYKLKFSFTWFPTPVPPFGHLCQVNANNISCTRFSILMPGKYKLNSFTCWTFTSQLVSFSSPGEQILIMTIHLFNNQHHITLYWESSTVQGTLTTSQHSNHGMCFIRHIKVHSLKLHVLSWVDPVWLTGY